MEPVQAIETAPCCASCTYENASGRSHWKVYGPDLNGHFGSLQGTGGLEATILDAGGTTQGVINDQFGNGVASVSGSTVTWFATRVGAYGPLPGSPAATLTDITQLAAATAWRGRRIDPTGFYDLGARYYEPTSGRFLSADPMGYGASPSLYDFSLGDPINRFDPDGRASPGSAGGVPSGGGQNPVDPNGGRVAPTGNFSLSGGQGSSLILYSSSELGGPNSTNVQMARAQGTDNKAPNGSNLNLTIDIDQAAKLGMSVNDYVAVTIAESTFSNFNNVVYEYHQGADGTLDPRIRSAFSGDSGLANIVSQALAPGGYLVLSGCFGTVYKTGAVNNLPCVQGIANSYGTSETTIVGGTGEEHPSAIDLRISTVPTGSDGEYVKEFDPVRTNALGIGTYELEGGDPTAWTVVPPNN